MHKLVLIFVVLFPLNLFAQIKIKGTVYDKSKINVVENVQVLSTGGQMTFTDSAGNYEISTEFQDSLSFVFGGKATMNFAVNNIIDKNHFDISLQLVVPSAKTYLQEVRLYSKSYRQDSLENREEYEKIFNFEKPGLSSTIGADGVAGADLDELINVFRFRRNKSLTALRKIMIGLEQDKYVNYRFSKKNIGRITGLKGELLDSFIVKYKPGYYFIVNKSDTEFNEYVLTSFYQFERLMKLSAIRPE